MPLHEEAYKLLFSDLSLESS